jgi:hypothetical protein
MATTAFHSAGLATLRRSPDRLAQPRFLTRLKAFFSQRSPEEERLLIRFAGQRLCDATERQLLDTVEGSGRSRNWL